MPAHLSIGFDVPFNEAIRAAATRGVVLPAAYYGELQGIARQLAFSIAGIARYDQLQSVRDSLALAMASGKSFKEWASDADVQNLGLPAHRLDNIWRTNLQGNYMRGRWQQFEENASHRPFLMYDAINDTRVRPSHLAHDGVIRAHDDPYWATNSPPLGYRCRCTLIALSESEAHARSGPGQGLYKNPTLPDGTPAGPDKGWDYNPAEDVLAAIRKAITDRRSAPNVSEVAITALTDAIESNLLALYAEWAADFGKEEAAVMWKRNFGKTPIPQ